jgi:hypothetical protein
MGITSVFLAGLVNLYDVDLEELTYVIGWVFRRLWWCVDSDWLAEWGRVVVA